MAFKNLVFVILLKALSIYMPLVMQIGLFAPQQGEASLVFAHFLVLIVFLGVLRNNSLCPTLTEVEYRSMPSTTTEITRITLLFDIDISLVQLPRLFCDNLSALHMSVNLILHARSKQSELDYHFVQEKIALATLSHDTFSHHLNQLISSPSNYLRLSFKC